MNGFQVALILAGVYTPAASTDSPFADWFRQLRVPHSLMPCCDISGCRAVSYREREGSYEIEVEGKWYLIPSDRVLRNERNPTMKAIACYNLLRLHTEIEIYCFMPPQYGA